MNLAMLGRFATYSAVATMFVLTTQSARAAFHLWDITEVYSNSDGSVQFIEFFTAGGGERFVDGHVVRATSDGDVKTFTFEGDLSGSTSNRRLLIATPGFGGLTGGVEADYDLDDPSIDGPFFDPAAASITIQFVGADQALTFPGSMLPTDGINSLNDANPNGTPNLSSGINSPTNFDRESGSVDLSAAPEPSGDYNGNGVVDAADYTVWRDTLGQSVAMDGDGADGDQSGEIDAGDYTYWADRFGDVVTEGGASTQLAPGDSSGANLAVVPEPAFMLLATIAMLPALLGRRQPRQRCE